jgi:nucleoside-diphosphate-sugar epimerase
MKGLRVLLTGASGLLGSHILDLLLQEGVEIVTFSRGVKKRSFLNKVLNHENLTFIGADLLEIENYASEIGSIDGVVNCAAFVSSDPGKIDFIHRSNIELTKKVYWVAGKLGARYWLQISSVATLASGETNDTINEHDHGSFRKTSYAESKYLIDQWLKAQSKIPVGTIYPCYLLGGYDSRPSSGAVILGIKLRAIKKILDGPKNFVAAKDVARCVVEMLRISRVDDFIVGGVNSTTKEFGELVLKKLGRNKDEIEFLNSAQILENDGNLNNFIQEFCISNKVDDSKIRNELGYCPSYSLEEMIDETINYFIEHKMLRI